ncbi:MmgE/PrpD family protein [Celeribacter indicus]|uniref:2-methylcitrate dehydratase n=1 Tax=Celeribacter indicus TaxID=1208324 RepID=A0A0B5E6W9_9RHOB|nr:MmgE/PrpD family protein [Celeribacter indicus]AJE49180.1 2-methylcitrate dehydratase [Celeribacter indicus]SDX18252.1 2-methylcitrate dehydratase [Celeribacter indicus]
MDATTIRLAETVARLTPDVLTEDTVTQAKRRIVDAIACAMGAFDEPFCARMREIAGRCGGGDTARIWGTELRSSVEMAGFCNGATLRYLDLNDTFLGASAGHPSDMIPALIALAEAEDTPGGTLIAAIVAAYELYCGLCDATALGPKGLDQSTAAALGAAGGASRLLGLDVAATGNAIALAVGANLNLYNVRCGTLSDWKACAGPNAARNGVFAALLAREGITGPTAVFEGKGGLGTVLGPFGLRETAPDRPRLLETRLKAYPVCYHGQSAVDAALDLAGRIGTAAIARVRIDTYEAAVRMMGADPTRWAPETRETADHSLPFTVGVALTTGRLTSGDYAAGRLADPELRRFMQRIEVREDPEMTRAYPSRNRTRITVTTAGGEEFTASRDHPKGHPDNPLSQAELAGKLESLWPVDRLPAAQVHQVLAAVEGLAHAPSVAPLVDALCPPR